MLKIKHPRRECGGGIAWPDFKIRLPQKGSVIKRGRDLMHRAAMARIPGIQSTRMRVEPLVSGQKRGMNIQHTPLPMRDEAGGENAHEASQTDNVRAGRQKRLHQLSLERAPVAPKDTVINRCNVDATCGRLGQTGCGRIIGQNQAGLCRVIGLHVVEKGQHVRPAARNQNRDFLTAHTSAPE